MKAKAYRLLAAFGLGSVLLGSLQAQTRIQPLGDSITHGFGGQNSYRRPLWQMLTNTGASIDFVGTQTLNASGPAPNPDFDLNHQGHSGFRAEQIASGLPGWMSGYTPDITLLHIGHNDIFGGQSIASTVTEIGQIIDALRAKNPNVKVLLAKIIPHTSGSVNASIDSLNAQIPGIAASKSTAASPVVVVDQNAGYNAATDNSDGTHPNATGDYKMAIKWYAALRQFLPGTPRPAPPTGLSAAPGNSQALLSWNASSGAASYSIKRSTASGGPYTTVASGVGSTSFTDGGLINGTTYFYVVSAVNGAGEGFNSLPASVLARALQPPVIRLGFNENSGALVTNLGTAGGTLTRTTPTPSWSGNVPALVGGASSIDFGTVTGNFAVDSPGVISQLAGLSAFTISGWLNCRSSTEGAGGNRVITWINNGGDGVDLVYKSNGSLVLGIDQWPDTSPAQSSAAKIPADASAGAGNWRFFAITYNSASGQVKFYFGSPSTDATLDVTRAYSRGPVNNSIGRLAVGHFNPATRTGATDRMFRGLIDDLQVHATDLTEMEVRSVQRGNFSVPPVVNLTSPNAGATFNATATISLAATASDSDGSVSKVEFFEGANKLGEDTSAPYEFLWTGVGAGNYTLTARATDNSGSSTASGSVNVTVTEPMVLYRAINVGGSPTVIDGQPWEGQTTTNYTFAGSIGNYPSFNFIPATDAARSNMIRTFVFGNTVELALTGVPAGAFDVYVHTFEDNVSLQGNLFVEGQLFASYASGPAGRWDRLGPFRVTVTDGALNVSYEILNGDMGPICGLEVYRAPAAPIVALTSPGEGAVLAVPATIPLAADALDPDGTITKIEFYEGATKLGEDTLSPYQFTWNNVGAGSYAITAQALDDSGRRGTSAPVNIMVRDPALFYRAINVAGPPLVIDGQAWEGHATPNFNAHGTAHTFPSFNLNPPTDEAHSNMLRSLIYGSLVELTMTAVPNGQYDVFLYTLEDNNPLTARFFVEGALVRTYTSGPAGRWDRLGPFRAAISDGALNVRAEVTGDAAPICGLEVWRVATPPAVALTTPAPGANFSEPATITLRAAATPSVGNVTNVEFFEGTFKLGEDTTSPYEFPWSHVLAGSYALTARATDDSGRVGASTPVNITVEALPAAAPTPLVKLAFDEGSGTAVTNSGSAGGTLTRTTPTPAWTSNAPGDVGANSAVDFGAATGNCVVESPAPIGALGGLNSFTISGWINNRSATEGGGGNRVVTWINNGGDGVDLVYHSDGSLHLGIDQWPDLSAARSSAGKITTDSAAGAGNWRFFAVTYDAGAQLVEFYFGSDTAPVTLDRAVSYTGRGAVGASIGRLAIGHFNAATRATALDRMLRGLVDLVQIHGVVLSPAQLSSLQRGRVSLPPSVTLTSPTYGSLFTEPASIPLAATAADTDGTVAKVEFFSGATKLGEDTTAPYELTWTGVPEGNYALSARATDDSGTGAASEAITIGVQRPLALYRAINVGGDAMVIDGQPWEGELTTNYASVGTLFTFPSFDFVPVTDQARSNMLRSLVFGNVVDLVLTAVPHGTYDVFVHTMEDNNPLEATLSLEGLTMTTYQSGPAGRWDRLGPFTVPVTDGALNIRYQITSGDAGPICGLEVYRTVGPPVVLITNLAEGATFSAPAAIPVRAMAIDADGAVVKVEFFAGGNKLGEDLSAPYELIWTNVAEGSYSLTARGTDDTGRVGTSPAVTVEVQASLPIVRLSFNETSGATTANTGSAGGSFALTTPTPGRSSNVPGSTGGARSVDFGATPGSFGVDSPSVINALGGLSSFTIVGWVNNASATEGGGGNRLVSWINNGGDGVDLVYRSDGSLLLGIDQWPDTSPARSSAFKVPTDPASGPQNWTFFAVTYNSALASNNAKFYFGTLASDAALDVARTYPRGPVGTSIGRLTIGHLNPAARAGASDRMLRGLLDEIKIYGSALNLSQLKSVQRGSGPSVVLTSPADGGVLTPPATIPLAADATHTDGTITKVEFYANSTKVGEDTAAPYEFLWTSVGQGAYSVTARAIDNLGRTNVSLPANISVHTPGTLYRAINVGGDPVTIDGQNWEGQSAPNYSSVGTLGNYPMFDFTPAVEGGRSNMLRTFVFGADARLQMSSVPAGAYEVFLHTFEDNFVLDGVFSVEGLEVASYRSGPAGRWDRLGPFTFAITDGTIDARYQVFGGDQGPFCGFEVYRVPAPLVSMTSPAPGASFVAPANVLLRATASDSDGTVTKVEFFSGTNNLGHDLTSPYEVTWTNLPGGTYTVTARAMDNTGRSSWAAPVVFTVLAAPLPPSNVQVLAGTGRAVLSWATSTNATSYNVKRSTTSGSGYAAIATGVTSLGYTNNGLANGTTYYYVVSAVNSVGESSNSTQVAATPLPGLDAIVHLPFDENGATTTANAGSAGGNLTLSTPTPAWTGNVPPTGGASAVDFGASAGNFVAESAAPLAALAGLNSFTICGWVNNRSAVEGGGGNRIVTWINNGGDGVDLVYHSDGSLHLGIDQWPDLSAARSSAGRITTDAAAGAANWRFFAVCYDSSAGQAKFYFGSPTADAALDVTRAYSRGPVNGNIGRLAVGHFNSATRSGALDRVFRGLIDNVRVIGSALSLSDLVAIQRGSGITPPAAPSGLQAVAGHTQVSLSWNGVAGAVGYNLKRSTSSGAGYITIASGIGAASFVDTGLSNGTTYYYVVAAINAGGEGSPSAQASATPVPPPVPSAPTGLAALATNAAVCLTWNGAVGATSYNVKRSILSGSGFTNIATGITTTNYTNSPLGNGVTYYYVVSALNAGGESANSTQASATPLAPPLPPSDLTATPGNGQVSLSWRAVSNAASYVVRRSFISGGPYTNIAAGLTATNYVNAGLSNGVTYFYVVMALNAGGASSNSAQVAATPAPPGPPGAPAGLAATPGDSLVVLTWSATAGATGYNLKRGTSSGGPYSLVASNFNLTTATNNGLANGATYFYVVSALNSVGESADSTQASATPVPPPPPPAPTGLQAVGGDTVVRLLWNASSGATGYNIRCSTNSGGPYSLIASNWPQARFTNILVVNGRPYYYVVSAVNGSGEGPVSAEVSATPNAGPVPIVRLTFNEGSGTTVANVGSAGGTLTRSSPLPAFSANVPSGVGGATSMDFGTATGNYAVDSPAPLAALAGLTQFTITGWVNNKSLAAGSGGNRLVTWINKGGDGVDLVYRSDGSLQIGIDQWPDSSPARSSAGKITTDAAASAGNWRFFAITYDSAAAQLSFYFGSQANDATLDVTRAYSRGAVGANVEVLTVGHLNPVSRAGALDRMFRGLIDEVQVFGTALSLAEIISVQRAGAAVAAGPPGEDFPGEGDWEGFLARLTMRLETVTHLSDGQVRLEGSGPAGQGYHIEASTNLENWTLIGTGEVGESGKFQFVDTSAPDHPKRFYRVFVPLP